MTWKVAKLSPGQLRDVRPEDVLGDGWFRKCETYRGGGGYDRFPEIAKRRLGYGHHKQFIVQLFGCHLDCPYCYVTRQGVWGEHTEFTTDQLVEAFRRAHRYHQTTVFHLMGGAPGLQLKQWPALAGALHARCEFPYVFHSDLLLTEGVYRQDALDVVAAIPNHLIALDVKGLTQEEHLANTRKPFREDLFWENLGKVERSGLNFYITFTNVSHENMDRFWTRFQAQWPARFPAVIRDAFHIDLIEYDALSHVDEVPWGRQA